MLRLNAIAFSACLVLCAAPVAALDLMQAYAAARTSDATTLAAVAAAQAGREVLPQARAQLLPSVVASITRNRNQLQSETPNFLGTISSTEYSYPSSSDSLQIRQPIYRKYQWAQYRQAQAQFVESEALLANEYQNLAVRVAGAYFEALLAQEQAALMKKQVESRRVTLDAARKLFEAGAGTRTDIDETQYRLDLAIAQELEARQAVDSSRQQLEVLVGQPVTSLAALRADRMKLEPPQPESVVAWIERAESASAELQVMRARLEAASREVEKASAGHHPTLDAIVQWSKTSSENNNSIDSRYETRSAGLQLNIPIFAGGGVNAAVRQALANEERARQALESVRRDIGVRVRKEYRGVTEGLLRIKALTQAVKSADQSVVSTQKSLLAGVRTRLEVLNAQDNQQAALRDLAQARFVYLISGVRLAALVNEANADAIQTLNLAFVEQ